MEFLHLLPSCLGHSLLTGISLDKSSNRTLKYFFPLKHRSVILADQKVHVALIVKIIA